MKFVSVRDLRGHSAQVWKELAERKEMVITSNGKPIAILCAVSEDSLEPSLSAIRRNRALALVTEIQMKSVERGRDRLTLAEINAEITAARKKLRA